MRIDSSEVIIVRKQKIFMLTGGITGILVLIFGGKIAIEGAQCGIEMCLQTLIPSLFSYFVLSGILTSVLIGQRIPCLAAIGRLCHMETGNESLLAVGMLGGYPTGAAMVWAAQRDGFLSVKEANRIAIFCNNAGPAFIFGVLGQLFPDIQWTISLWLIQIISSVVTGWLVTGGPGTPIRPVNQKIRITDIVNQAIRNMASVCGWVILFRMILEFLDRWVFWILRPSIQVLLSGLLELSNGCLRLQDISDLMIRFLLASMMLSAGGVCVLTQTIAVFPELNIKTYLKGRTLHLLISTLLSASAVSVLSGQMIYAVIPLVLLISVLTVGRIGLRKNKIAVAIP